MANIIPLKCANNQHKPMVPGEDKIDSSLLPNLIAGEGIQITKDANGDFVITNLCCDDDTGPVDPVDSTHTIASITPASNPVIEGQTACFNVVLNGPVTGSSLQLDFSLGGSDQIRNNYAAPSLVIPVGQSSGQVCVNTTDDLVVDGTEVLVITSVTNNRVTNSANSSVNVLDNDDSEPPAPQIINITSDATSPVPDGQDICYTVYSDLPAPAGGLPFVVTVSGDDSPGGNVCGSYDGSTNGPVIATLSGSIPQGQTQATVCYVRDVAEPADSSHQVTVNVATNTVEEGQQICWNFVTTGVVAGSPLTIPFTFSGTEQSVHNYPVANVVVPVGQTQAQYCLTITDDAIVEGPLELCLDVTVGGRVTSTQSADNCVTVNDNDSSAPSIAFSGMGYNWGDCIGGATVTQARLRIEVRNDGTYEVRTITSASPSGQNIVQDSGTWATGAFNAADYNVIFTGSGAPNSEGTPNPNGGNLASLQVLEWMDGMDPTAQIVNGDVQIRDASNNVLASLPIYVTLSSNVECP